VHRRGGIDAVLELDGREIPDRLKGASVPFELKSATLDPIAMLGALTLQPIGR
jgi:hypothetical protein